VVACAGYVQPSRRCSEIMLALSLGYNRTPSLVKLDQQVKLEQSLARHRGSAFFHGNTSTR
jgi:hypothetical protein